MVHTFKTSWHSGLAEQSLCTCYEHGRFPGAPNVMQHNAKLVSKMKCLLLVPYTACASTVVEKLFLFANM